MARGDTRHIYVHADTYGRRASPPTHINTPNTNIKTPQLGGGRCEFEREPPKTSATPAPRLEANSKRARTQL
eukprot:scaffold19471_cov108-Isochrysis_galbana.AAC.3